ncbi:sodium-coupled monocarboxylate transporter 2-like [Ornithodoros turicata]|uniref:sodium-coupled monocarboxylate transporter 2-like n=1 Tax=Ornithodoros turicata TaxID=34597 RepID=UPI00313876D9
MTSQFSIADFGVLAAVLGISALIGVYFAWKGRKSTNNKEFLVGNRRLQVFPVTLSMMASFLSSIALIGIPAENYVHSFQYIVCISGIVISIILAAHVFLPVFYDMEMVSVNQYLEKRFKSVFLRKLTSLLTILQVSLYMGIVLYGPSLALGSVTGLPIWLSIILNGTVCAFYTALGGIKAVVWTDVVQMLLMITGFLMVIIKGSIMAGGIDSVFQTAKEAGTLVVFDFSADVHKTFTFWSILFGGGMHWIIGFCTSQTIVQRYCGLPSKSNARRALYANMLGISFTVALSCVCGLVLFSVYRHCDPVKASVIRKYDELMPHFVAENLNYMPGLSGLFVAAVYSGSLSTMSSGYNSMAAITWEDFIQSKFKLSPAAIVWTTKGIAAAYGLLAIVIAFLASFLSSVLRASYVLTGAAGGATGALFFIGVLFPWCGKKAALLSLLLGMGVSAWISVGSIIYPKQPAVARTGLDGCTFNYTLRGPSQGWYPTEGILKLYHIGYPWVPAISFFTTLAMGMLIPSLFGFKNADPVDPKLLTPVVRRFYTRPGRSGETTLNDKAKNKILPLGTKNNQTKGCINPTLRICNEKQPPNLSSTTL